MGRLLFLFAVIVVVYWLLRSYRQQAPKQDERSTSSEEMVRCIECGVHLPKSEAVLSNGNLFCSEAHRREHESK